MRPARHVYKWLSVEPDLWPCELSRSDRLAATDRKEDEARNVWHRTLRVSRVCYAWKAPPSHSHDLSTSDPRRVQNDRSWSVNQTPWCRRVRPPRWRMTAQRNWGIPFMYLKTNPEHRNRAGQRSGTDALQTAYSR